TQPRRSFAFPHCGRRRLRRNCPSPSLTTETRDGGVLSSSDLEDSLPSRVRGGSRRPSLEDAGRQRGAEEGGASARCPRTSGTRIGCGRHPRPPWRAARVIVQAADRRRRSCTPAARKSVGRCTFPPPASVSTQWLRSSGGTTVRSAQGTLRDRIRSRQVHLEPRCFGIPWNRFRRRRTQEQRATTAE